MKIIHLSYTLLLVALLAFSCKKNTQDPAPAPVSAHVVTIKNLPANSGGQINSLAGHFTFFSFKDSTVISLTDSASTKWDIGFNETTIVVNGGTSGPGVGGAQVYTGLFDDLAEAPGTGYKTDNKNALPPYAIPTGSGNGWYNYNSTSHVITPIPGRVLLIRTADGKYAKVEIISYYKDMPINPTSDSQARYYTFRYVYQPDGSLAFN